MNSPEPKPKRRFRFSLRTLLLVVLAYGLCWALSASWGVSSLGDQLELEMNKAVNHRTERRSSDQVNVIFYDVLIPEPKDRTYLFNGRSPLPFYVTWSVDWESSTGEKVAPAAWGERKYLWIFGWSIPLNKPYYHEAIRKK